MRVVFMGTPEFAVPSFLEILRHGHVVVAAFTRPPARSGRRGLEITKSPVQLAAESSGIPIFTPTTLRGAETLNIVGNLAADIAVVVAYGLLLPSRILAAPRLGCINLHASLLPRWRGAAPIQRAIMAGDSQTGVVVMRMDAGLDSGPIAAKEAVTIRPEDTAGDLAARLSVIASRQAIDALRKIEAGALEFDEQIASGVLYAPKIENGEAEVDWARGAEEVRNQIHGLSPSPGARSAVLMGDREEVVKFLRVEAVPGNGPCGAILSEDFVIACGRGAVKVVQAQRSGKSAISGADLMRGSRLTKGTVFRAHRLGRKSDEASHR